MVFPFDGVPGNEQVITMEAEARIKLVFYQIYNMIMLPRQRGRVLSNSPFTHLAVSYPSSL